MFVSSAKELKSTRNLVICAMMAALAIVLSYTTSVYITPTIKVGFPVCQTVWLTSCLVRW